MEGIRKQERGVDADVQGSGSAADTSSHAERAVRERPLRAFQEMVIPFPGFSKWIKCLKIIRDLSASRVGFEDADGFLGALLDGVIDVGFVFEGDGVEDDG
jgi:hypothetical protein